ncbi:anthranilate synthase component II [Duncaniella muris]|uniref:anthranilate synthase component II n=1 Tax=Duncaniella muris TaxID=2094150 RepID=UPI002676DF1F|nr:aminodeoxychorismate/anthranilate synthase component II [Duncaniella muris]
MRLLIIDNHDSFVHNIIGLLRDCVNRMPFQFSWNVVKNDEIPFDSIDNYDALIISPGPGLPAEASGLMKAIDLCSHTKPILGICLGCQAIAEYFGGSLTHLDHPAHGHLSRLKNVDSSDPLLGCIECEAITVGRYHSWIVAKETLPPSLAVSSQDEDGNIMSVRHTELPVFGLQFHPESIISNCGADIIGGFLSIVRSQTSRAVSLD